MKVKLWGVRGSLPSPVTPAQTESRLATTLQRFEDYKLANSAGTISEFIDTLPQHLSGGYGGNTACMEVQVTSQKTNEEATESIIIDGGSGIRGLGESMLSGSCGRGQGRVNILFTHFHWDHVIGLPFFIPFFIPGNEIHCYAVSPGLEENIRRMFTKPNFPVPFERLGAKIFFHQLKPRETIEMSGAKVTPYQLDHPDPCWGYKIENDGRVFSYCVDTEGVRTSEEELGADLPLYQNVDVMIFDAQYSFLEAAERVDWGHSSSPIGLTLAMREKIDRVYFIHHDPASKDEKIGILIEQTEDFYQQQVKANQQAGKKVFDVEWTFAHEGMLIDI